MKVVASFLDSDYFLVAMLDKFDLVDWSRLVQYSYLNYFILQARHFLSVKVINKSIFTNN